MKTNTTDLSQYFSASDARTLTNDAKSLDGKYKRAETFEVLSKIKHCATIGDMTLIRL